MVKKLVVKTNNPQTIIDMMHELGTSFHCKTSQNEYRVIYFATNREVHFEGSLTPDQLAQIKAESKEVKSIRIDEFAGEIIIEEA